MRFLRYIMMNGVLIVLAGALPLSAQAGLGIAGGNEASDEYSFSYSVGQIFNNVITQSGYYISQGIQHPTLLVISESGPEQEQDLNIHIYPNPTAARLNISLPDSDFSACRVQLINSHGQLLLERKLETADNDISLEAFAAGHYFLRIMQGTLKPRIFKVIKNK